MPERVRIIAARRCYDYAPDDVRLTQLTLPEIAQRLQQSLNFQTAQVATPPATFGPVPVVFPPGLVLNYGYERGDDGVFTPIRYANIEQQRIVIDVAGHSSILDTVFHKLTGVLDGLAGPDGSPILGKPVGTRDYSEVTCHLDIPPDALAGVVHDAFAQALGGERERPGHLVPAVVVRMLPAEQEYPGLVLPDSAVAQLELRAGTRPEDRTYFSAAPLPCDAHLTYLERIEQTLRAAR